MLLMDTSEGALVDDRDSASSSDEVPQSSRRNRQSQPERDVLREANVLVNTDPARLNGWRVTTYNETELVNAIVQVASDGST